MFEVWTMMRKEFAELAGNRRFFLVFLIAVLAMAFIPSLTYTHHHAGLGGIGVTFLAFYIPFAAVIVVSNTAPDLVLHERVGHTLDYLLTTRLSDRAIFGAKVMTAFLVGYVAAMLAVGAQLLAVAILSRNGLHWLYLAVPSARIIVFGVTAGASLYVAVVGTFVALRVGEQRAAYMVTILSVFVLAVPFIVGWIPLSLTTQGVGRDAEGLAIIALALNVIGLRLFRRDMLVLYLQE